MSTRKEFEISQVGGGGGVPGPPGAPGADGTVTIEDLTHSELTSRATAGSGDPLESGQWYRVTDFRTRHDIPFTSDTHTEVVEPLIIPCLQGTTGSDDAILSKVVYSEDYPDDVINYDHTSTLYGGDRGVILMRHDTKLNIKTHYDFRGVKFRRYAVGAVAPTLDNVTYGFETYVLSGYIYPEADTIEIDGGETTKTIFEDIYTFENKRGGHELTKNVEVGVAPVYDSSLIPTTPELPNFVCDFAIGSLIIIEPQTYSITPFGYTISGIIDSDLTLISELFYTTDIQFSTVKHTGSIFYTTFIDSSNIIINSQDDYNYAEVVNLCRGVYAFTNSVVSDSLSNNNILVGFSGSTITNFDWNTGIGNTQNSVIGTISQCDFKNTTLVDFTVTTIKNTRFINDENSITLHTTANGGVISNCEFAEINVMNFTNIYDSKFNKINSITFNDTVDGMNCLGDIINTTFDGVITNSQFHRISNSTFGDDVTYSTIRSVENNSVDGQINNSTIDDMSSCNIAGNIVNTTANRITNVTLTAGNIESCDFRLLSSVTSSTNLENCRGLLNIASISTSTPINDCVFEMTDLTVTASGSLINTILDTCADVTIDADVESCEFKNLYVANFSTNLDNAIIHEVTPPSVTPTDTFDFNPSTGFGKVLDVRRRESSHQVTIDITGLTAINPPSSDRDYTYAGVINLTSTNASETISNISTTWGDFCDIVLIPEFGLTITLLGVNYSIAPSPIATEIAAPKSPSVDFLSPAATANTQYNGSRYDTVRLRKNPNNNVWYVVDSNYSA